MQFQDVSSRRIGARTRSYSRRFRGFGDVVSDAQMVRGDSGDTSAIYYLINGVKRHITTMDVVNALGGTGAVASVDSAALAATPSGADINSVADVAGAAAVATNPVASVQNLVSTITGVVPSSVLAKVGLGPTAPSTSPQGGGAQAQGGAGSSYSKPLFSIGSFQVTPAVALGLGAVAVGIAYLSRKKGRG